MRGMRGFLGVPAQGCFPQQGRSRQGPDRLSPAMPRTLTKALGTLASVPRGSAMPSCSRRRPPPLAILTVRGRGCQRHHSWAFAGRGGVVFGSGIRLPRQRKQVAPLGRELVGGREPAEPVGSSAEPLPPT